MLVGEAEVQCQAGIDRIVILNVTAVVLRAAPDHCAANQAGHPHVVREAEQEAGNSIARA